MAAQAEKMAGKSEKMAEEVDREVEPTYDIEGIVGYRRKKGKMEFNVKWAGYSYKENSWEGLENLEPAIIWVVDYLEDQDMMPLLDEVYTFYGIVEKAPKKDKNQKKVSKKTTKEDTDQEVEQGTAKNKKSAKDVDVRTAKKDKNLKKATEENEDQEVEKATVKNKKTTKNVNETKAKKDEKSKKTAEDNLDKDVKKGTANIADQKKAKRVDMATVKYKKQEAVKYLKQGDKKNAKKEDPIFYVEGISCHRRRYNKLQFFVKWAEYEASDNTWETLENLRTAKTIVYDYLKRCDLNDLIQEVKVYYGDV